MTVGIYGLFNNKNNDCLYIGQSNDIEYRTSRHLSKLRNGKHKRKEMQKYYDELNDKSVLKFFIIEETADEHYIKNKAEMKWFKVFDPLFYGVEPSLESTNWSYSEDVKNKISRSLKQSYKDSSEECDIEDCNNRCHRGRVVCKKCRSYVERQGSIYVYNVRSQQIEDILFLYQECNLNCTYIAEKLNINITIIYMILYEKDVILSEIDKEDNPLYDIHHMIHKKCDPKEIAKKIQHRDKSNKKIYESHIFRNT